MLFKVTKQYGRSTEIIAGSFSVLLKAREFMQHEAKNDAQMKIQALYRIYEFDEVIDELDTMKMDDAAPGHKQPEQQSGSGAGKSSGFRPTPLGMTAKPKGSIHQSKEDDDKKD